MLTRRACLPHWPTRDRPSGMPWQGAVEPCQVAGSLAALAGTTAADPGLCGECGVLRGPSVHLQYVHPTGRPVRHVCFAAADDGSCGVLHPDDARLLDATSSDGRDGNGPIWSGEARVEVILHPGQSLPGLALRWTNDCHRDKNHKSVSIGKLPAILRGFRL